VGTRGSRGRVEASVGRVCGRVFGLLCAEGDHMKMNAHALAELSSLENIVEIMNLMPEYYYT